MDLDMPVLDGFEATKIIINFWKEKNIKSCPILACSASMSDFDKKKAISVGMCDYLEKPVKIE